MKRQLIGHWLRNDSEVKSGALTQDTEGDDVHGVTDTLTPEQRTWSVSAVDGDHTRSSLPKPQSKFGSSETVTRSEIGSMKH